MILIRIKQCKPNAKSYKGILSLSSIKSVILLHDAVLLDVISCIILHTQDLISAESCMGYSWNFMFIEGQYTWRDVNALITILFVTANHIM